jgi:hypothetical protein
MKSKIIRYKIALFLLFSSFWSFAAQVESNNSPYDVVYNHVHFMKKSTYDELQASYSFNIANKKKRINAAIMLKEIWMLK